MKYKITVLLKNVMLKSTDEESVREEVKEALIDAIDSDDEGDGELEFTLESEDSEDDF